MPINKIVASLRGKKAVAAAVVFAATSGWTAYNSIKPLQPVAVVQVQQTVRPAVVAPALTPEKLIHQQVAQGKIPPAVRLAIDVLIKPWEGLRNKAYRDSIGKPTICYGDTMLDGRPVHMGDQRSNEVCEALLIQRVIHDYYLPLVDGVDDYAIAPLSLQASMLSGAYNFGVGAAENSRTADFVTSHQYQQACIAQTAFNKAKIHGHSQVLPGLVVRREMGDKQRLGEAELCVSGLN